MIPLLLLIAVSIACCFGVYYSSQQNKKFLHDYACFLKANEGKEFFCYTNRENFVDFIETRIIPNLDPAIYIVKLEGKTPHTELDKDFISYALYRIKNTGFPNVMKIVNGQLIDLSLHNHLYNAINNQKHDEIHQIVRDALVQLRAIVANDYS